MWQDFLRFCDLAFKFDFSVYEKLECPSFKDLHFPFFLQLFFNEYFPDVSESWIVANWSRVCVSTKGVCFIFSNLIFHLNIYLRHSYSHLRKTALNLIEWRWWYVLNKWFICYWYIFGLYFSFFFYKVRRKFWNIPYNFTCSVNCPFPLPPFSLY